MRHSGSHTALADAVARFQAEMQRLAFAAVRAVIEQELARRRARPEPARKRRGRSAPQAQRQLELGFAPTPQRQLALPLAPRAALDAAAHAESPVETRAERERAGAADAAAPAMPTAEPPPPQLAAGDRGRGRWTRDAIIGELATWLLSGTVIDAQFMTRNGPRGLVAAARRVFGRFDAALNVAALHNAKLYPDGPPARGAGRVGPTMPAVASRPKQD